MARNVVTTITDDITGIKYIDGDVEMQNVKSYRVTIEELDENGLTLAPSLETRFVYEIDVHVNTMNAIRQLFTDRLLFPLMAVLGIAAGKPAVKPSADTSGFVPHIRAYAIAKGKINSTKGKLSQDIVSWFIAETGITREDFDRGARAVIGEPSDS